MKKYHATCGKKKVVQERSWKIINDLNSANIWVQKEKTFTSISIRWDDCSVSNRKWKQKQLQFNPSNVDGTSHEIEKVVVLKFAPLSPLQEQSDAARKLDGICY